MTALAAAAVEILDWLRAGGWESCLIGGMAVQRWGEPRLTQDVDVTVLVGPGLEPAFVDATLAGFSGRRPDARAFALAYRVLLIRAGNGVPVDLALGGTGFEIESVRRSTAWEIEPGCRVPTCSAEDLIVHKLIAGRPRDIADLDGIVGRQAGQLDMELIRRWVAGFADVLENPDLGRPLERALGEVRRRTP